MRNHSECAFRDLPSPSPIGRFRERSYTNGSTFSENSIDSADLTIEELIFEQDDDSERDALAEIHFVACELYCQERIAFSNKAALFHLNLATEMNNVKALSILGRKLMEIQTEELERLVVEADVEKGFAMVKKASDLGDLNCSYLIASAHFTGNGLPPSERRDWLVAERGFRKLQESGFEVGIPSFRHMECRAIMKSQGGHGMVKDLSEASQLFEAAANEALSKGKGKYATMLFEKAENVSIVV